MDIDLVNNEACFLSANKSANSFDANLGSFISKGFNSLNSLEIDQAEAKTKRKKKVRTRLVEVSIDSSEEPLQSSSDSCNSQ